MRGVAVLMATGLALTACSRDGGGAARTDAAEAPAATGSAASTPSGGLAPSDMPTQRPGLWRITADMPQIGRQTMDLCVTPDMVASGQAMTPGAQTGDCGPPQISRDGGAMVVRSTCGSGEARTETVVRATGDFQREMRSEVEVRAGGQSVMRMTSTGTYVGPCPAG